MISSRTISGARSAARDGHERHAADRPLSREQWLAVCVRRLAELRPRDPPSATWRLAQEMWDDVGGFDPLIVAEMEYEASLSDA